MQRADCILTDSGEIQEEAPYLGKPVLVMREVTERPEAVAVGAVRLVGTDTRRIVDAVRTVFDSHAAWRCAAPTMYGDGYAAERIVAALRGQPVDDFMPVAAREPEVSAA